MSGMDTDRHGVQYDRSHKKTTPLRCDNLMSMFARILTPSIKPKEAKP
jgi:hypothetical protein